MKGDPVGFGFVSCGCGLCEVHAELVKNKIFEFGGWADRRRYYLESEEDFLKRVPDGFTKWPKDHININPNPLEIKYMPDKGTTE